MSNIESIRSVYDAFIAGDIATVLGAMDPQIEWREAEGNPYRPSGEPWIGPDQILQNLFVRLGAEWDGFTVHPKEFYDAGGGTVVTEGRYSGVHKATGISLDAQFCHVFRVRDGKVTSFQQYTDTAAMQRAMG